MEKLRLEDLDLLTEKEFTEMEQTVFRLLSCWQVSNMRGALAVYWDDQRIGEKRHEYMALKHPAVDAEAEMAFRRKAVVDSLEGNTLVHPLTTPVLVVNRENTKCRSCWKSLGVEGLSKHREMPEAVVSIGSVPGVNVVEDGEWKKLSGDWLRLTKNEYHKGWVDSMLLTNTRPPLTEEQDREMFGKYAYRKAEIRQPVPEPPREDTWEVFPDETDMSWQFLNLEERQKEKSRRERT